MRALVPTRGCFAVVPIVAALCMPPACGAQTLPEILSRLSEEAEVFRHVAREILAEETLTQRALKAPARFHPRLGTAAATARHSLALGLASADDHARKRMLEDFQKYGLATAVVDFGPLLLLFTK